MLFSKPIFLSLSDPETIVDTFDSAPFPACHPKFFCVLGIQLLTPPPLTAAFIIPLPLTFRLFIFRFKSLCLLC